MGTIIARAEGPYPGRAEFSFDDNYFEINSNGIITLKANSAPLPIGSIIPFAGPKTEVPGGGLWEYCEGTELNRTTYATLFGIIGTYWGVGDGSTTFNIPDLRGIFLRGQDDGQGNDPDAVTRTGGDNVGSEQGSALWGHHHIVRDNDDGDGLYNVENAASDSNYKISHSATETDIQAQDIINDGVHGLPDLSSESRPPNKNCIFIIRVA